MTREQYKKQKHEARAIARKHFETEHGRNQFSAAIIRIMEQFNATLTIKEDK